MTTSFSGSPERVGTTCKTRAKIKWLAQIFDFLTSMTIGFSGSPEQMGATCKTRAKIKGLEQIFGLVDLNDDRLQLLFNHIFNFDIYTLFIFILGV